jgi:hypothetical protein
MLARTKQPPQPPTLPERIRAAAGKVRELDAELKEVVEMYIDQEKAKYDGLPREVLHKLLFNRYGQPWLAVLGLESELGHE